MKLKYTGPFAPTTDWVEHFYHETVMVHNGVAETDTKETIDALKQRGFIPYSEWEEQQATEAEERRLAEEKRIEEYRKQLEEDRENAAKTLEEAESRTKREEAKLAKEAAKADGAKPIVTVEDDEKSVVVEEDKE